MQIPQTKNAKFDFLARMASSNDYDATSEICIEIRRQPSTEGERALKIKEQDEWMTLIVRYLKERWLPKNKTEARKIQIRVAHFVIINDALYKRGYSLPYLRCVNLEEADYVFREIWEGICGNHAGARSLVGKTLRVGYN